MDRVHVIEYDWLKRLLSTTLYAYPFDARAFRPFGDPPHAHVAEREVRPLRAPVPVADLAEQHARAGIELRVVDDLFRWWEQVVDSGLGYSGIRLRNAANPPRT